MASDRKSEPDYDALNHDSNSQVNELPDTSDTCRVPLKRDDHDDSMTTERVCVVEEQKQQEKAAPDSYQVPWLPHMMISTDTSLPYMVDSHAEKIAPDLISPNSYVQLPPAYHMSSQKDIYNYMMQSSSMIPLEGYSMVGYQNFGKIGTNHGLPTMSSDQTDLSSSVPAISKSENVDTATDLHRDLSTSLAHDSLISSQAGYCGYCHKYYKNEDELQTHIMMEHPEHSQMTSYLEQNSLQNQFHTCPSCGNTLTKVGSYDPEFNLIEPTDDSQNLNFSHGGSILMVCHQCCKEFTLSVTTEHASAPPPQQEASKRYFCQHCQRSYKHNRDLLKHLRSSHGVDTSAERNQQSVFPSGIHSSQGMPSSDIQSHPAKLTCHLCNKMFRGPFELKRHNHTVHENKRPYKCKECIKSFRDAYELKRHSASHARLRYHTIPNTSGNPTTMEIMAMQTSDTVNVSSLDHNRSDIVTPNIMHAVYTIPNTGPNYHQPMGNVDYYCHSCEKNFRGANEFKRHYSVVHEKKYRYKCIHCGKLWRDQYDLKRHCLRSHKMDKDIDRAFIRQCLLDNTTDSNVVAVQPTLSMPSYELGDNSTTITLNQETAEAIFGSTDQDIRNQSTQVEPFSLMSHSDIITPNPQVNIFANLSSLPNTSMLYHQSNSSHLVDNIIQPTDESNIVEESKNAATWTSFESDLQTTPPRIFKSSQNN